MVSGNKEMGSSSAEEATKWISLDNLKKALEELPTPLRTKVMDRVEGNASTGFVAGVKPEVADLLLEEVARRVFGFSLADLTSPELREIEFIRKELGLPGESNSST